MVAASDNMIQKYEYLVLTPEEVSTDKLNELAALGYQVQLEQQNGHLIMRRLLPHGGKMNTALREAALKADPNDPNNRADPSYTAEDMRKAEATAGTKVKQADKFFSSQRPKTPDKNKK